MNISTHDHPDRTQLLLQLRVNPRNARSLLDANVLVCVPTGHDGSAATVSSVGRSIGKGKIDARWSGNVTRILSWRMSELYSGAICEFEAVFPRGGGGGDDEDEEDGDGGDDDGISTERVKFPVMLRYDSEGSLLSDVVLDFGGGGGGGAGGGPAVRRSFRVYHREV